jgi:sigma-E factor negative regulatory protein RseB
MTPRAMRASERLAAAGVLIALAGAACAEAQAQAAGSARSTADPSSAQRSLSDPSSAQTSAADASPKPSIELTPAQWLQRMNQALAMRNYEGTFSHWQGGRVEMLRILHRVQDGAVAERLASLDGSGREFIRTGANLACYLPDKRTVVVEQRPAQQSLVGFPAIDPQTAAFYDIREVTHMRLNRRITHVITVSPKDDFRYGYRLWIDDSTAMPLKTQLCDAHGHVIEQMVFANLTLNPHLPDSAFRPEVSTEGYTWLRNDPPQPAAGTPLMPWHARQLPPGFRMTVQSAQTLPGASGPVDHMVFSDGVASVSVFVEQLARPPSGASEVVAQSATVGSSSAYSTVVDGHKVTAVGEVPPDTVRLIATEVQAAQQPEMPMQPVQRRP